MKTAVFFVLVLAAVHSLEDMGENAGQVTELAKEHAEEHSNTPYAGMGGDDTHPGNEVTKDLTGNYGQGPGYYGQGFANFPGPKYGLPGYKESHNWEQGVDIFSPVVFNMDYYRTKTGSVAEEKDLKLDWIDKLTSNSVGSCPKGRIDWDLDKLYTNYPSSYTGTDDNGNPTPATCMKVVTDFLTTGIYNGHQGYTAYKILDTSVSPHVRAFATTQGKDTLTADYAGLALVPDLTYTYTFWLKAGSTASGVSNILWYGKCDGTPLDCIAPTVGLSFKDASTDLVFQVKHSDDSFYSCEATSAVVTSTQPGKLVLGQWYYIALAVESFHSTSSKMILYIDGVVGCEKDSTTGTTMVVDTDAKLYMGQGVMATANADVDKVMFYPGRQIPANELAVQEVNEQTPPPPP